MREIEELLKNNKEKIDNLVLPDELEDRLRGALENQEKKSKSNNKWIFKVASILILIILISYNFDTLAYFSKKITGFDPVMNSTLKELNEIGKGQVIGKSFTFENGISVTLDAVMVDDNQLLLFYTEKFDEGNIGENGIESIMSIDGFMGTLHEKGGQGIMNDEKTEMKWIISFDAPKFFQKEFKWEFGIVEGGKTKRGEITFTLDRSKAMGCTLKSRINKSVKLNDRKIKFDSIQASETSTVIKGSIQNIFQLALDQVSDNRIRPESLELKLIANGKELQWQGKGMSTNFDGIKFDYEFEPLPKHLDDLKIKVIGLIADYDEDKIVDIVVGDNIKTINIQDQNIIINKVYESDKETFVTITTEDHVVLSRIFLMIDGKKVELQNTISNNNEKKRDGVITHTRTLKFVGTGEKLELKIERIKYKKTVNEVIDIPVK
ncbi:DUF4179 domain-containing protein [Tepidibacter hydrothermalis]|uniref:DUF4179 domain-containing protein n=1 Tax=Tepidibacter hydrothermalis TaxID=3036126 RepID=A0ABY8ED99_9FIRM|nr:DUF4179 domain-containing protein [Tepidibacter hydrothermalis]WFD10914.1 DUF4179 domain-containing protein [Tepidibacter hydrothermalis]